MKLGTNTNHNILSYSQELYSVFENLTTNNLCRAMVTFSVNVLLGKKKSKDNNESLWIGDWAPQNARDLMAYTVSKGYKIDSYEMGT